MPYIIVYMITVKYAAEMTRKIKLGIFSLRAYAVVWQEKLCTHQASNIFENRR
jgi:hypothetical protein